ncbi:cysteine desulfurase CsdA [Candidatus Pantoea edessiphila]|uniref:Cysteine desulfurase n=1 Tax=Candidatus Pantoea edessiphila TaxID=2044610 RepID=A0A2P5SYR2_9GAMM|nr:SufS family cysteine desulfurase [Candidatus Pantoea edessiphila]MBK4775389.1 SufS family cysteine desulfurase [Pantoea sp. Edef]PPI87481.1 cysteine desulfurase CsdA [Candidatus Pantoea edessiphila]
MTNFNLELIRNDFPIFKRKINGHYLAYFDNAASSQRPSAVIDAEKLFNQNNYANVHRGVHTLSAQATILMENVRNQVARFINASSKDEIIFVKGTTEGINLIANSWGSKITHKDNIIITEMEHHSNIVPWQLLAKRVKAEIRILPLKGGILCLETLSRLIDSNTRLLALTHVSNVIGVTNPIKKIIDLIKSCGIITVIDGAQAVMHHGVDVQDLGCDFYVFSGHKIYGPTGIGILYGRKNILNDMPPWEGGGAMINNVKLPYGTTWNDIPWRFEAGTPNISGIVGLGAALNYIKNLGLDVINKRETSLCQYAQKKLSLIPNITLYSHLNSVGIISFNLGKHHAFDVGSFLDQYGIAIRTGHHCAMPLMRYYKVTAMCRASLAFYNSEQEIDRLVSSLIRINHLLNN